MQKLISSQQFKSDLKGDLLDNSNGSLFNIKPVNDWNDETKQYNTFKEYLCDRIGMTLNLRSAKVLIIDNISYLKNGTEKASEATPLIIFLNKLKKKYGSSILVLAHTRKRDCVKLFKITERTVRYVLNKTNK